MRQVVSIIIFCLFSTHSFSSDLRETCRKLNRDSDTVEVFFCLKLLDDELTKSDNKILLLEERLDDIQVRIKDYHAGFSNFETEFSKVKRAASLNIKGKAEDIAAFLMEEHAEILRGPAGPEGPRGQVGPKGIVGPKGDTGDGPSVAEVAAAMMRNAEFRDLVKAAVELSQGTYTQREGNTHSDTQVPTSTQANPKCFELNRGNSIDGYKIHKNEKFCYNGRFFGYADIIINLEERKFVFRDPSGGQIDIREGESWQIKTIPGWPRLHIRSLLNRETAIIGIMS